MRSTARSVKYNNRGVQLNNKVAQKINGYVNIAKRANYVIWGTDNLDGYSHKLYLVLYREDFGKTIQKTIQKLEACNCTIKMLSVNDFNEIAGTNKSKIFAIKNKGISEQIINLLRGEDG